MRKDDAGDQSGRGQYRPGGHYDKINQYKTALADAIKTYETICMSLCKRSPEHCVPEPIKGLLARDVRKESYERYGSQPRQGGSRRDEPVTWPPERPGSSLPPLAPLPMPGPRSPWDVGPTMPERGPGGRPMPMPPQRPGGGGRKWLPRRDDPFAWPPIWM